MLSGLDGGPRGCVVPSSIGCSRLLPLRMAFGGLRPSSRSSEANRLALPPWRRNSHKSDSLASWIPIELSVVKYIVLCCVLLDYLIYFSNAYYKVT